MASRRRRRRNQRKRQQERRASSALPSFLQRRSTRWLIAAIVTLAVGIGIGLLAQSGDDEHDATLPVPTLAFELPEIAPDPAFLQSAAVVRVIDGDTIDVRVGGDVERVRYYGIDTPERGERCFDEATDRNESLVGGDVLLLADARDRDPNGRLLRYVFTPGGESIDARLIAEGLAEAWRADGAYRDELVALEADARAEGVGCLWQAG